MYKGVFYIVLKHAFFSEEKHTRIGKDNVVNAQNQHYA